MNPHAIFKSIEFSSIDNGPNFYTYTMVATLHNGVSISGSMVLSKDMNTDVSVVEDKLVDQLIAHVTKQLVLETHDAWMNHLHELKKKHEQYQKLQMMSPLNTGIIGQFTAKDIWSPVYKNEESGPVVHVAHTSLDADGIVSIFDKKKDPMFLKSEAQQLLTNEMIDALVKMTLEKIDVHNDFTPAPNMMQIALKTFPGLSTIVSCPHVFKTGKRCIISDNCTLADTIIHLNDHHKYPRKEIAGWLDTLDIDLSVPIEKEQVNAEN